MEKDGQIITSLVVKFDELTRNSSVLQNSSEQEFLRFVLNAGVNRRRWEHAELECQRLGIELTKASQEITSLEHKLSHARTLLDNELSLRKKVEAERDRLSGQLQLLRELVLDDHLVDEVKLSRLRNLGTCELGIEENIFFPCANTPKGILKRVNQTEESIRDVEDLSFDDTRDLCSSRSRLTRRSDTRKRSRSVGRDNLEENVLQNIGSPPRREQYQLKKRTRRSRSVVAFEREREVTSSEEAEVRPRAYSTNEQINSAYRASASTEQSTEQSTEHSFEKKTILKGEKCSICDKRIKFGKIGLKCKGCCIILHSECSDRVPPICAGKGSPQVFLTPVADRHLSPMKKPYFASPMCLRREVEEKVYLSLVNRRIQAGEDPYPVTFCRQVTKVEYEKSKLTGAETALLDLLQAILVDTKMTEKEKIKKLKRFKESYPDLWRRKFPSENSEPDLIEARREKTGKFSSLSRLKSVMRI